ncbi:MAG: hypothetical protein AB6733_20335 [Clostridiaceae bacterium]
MNKKRLSVLLTTALIVLSTTTTAFAETKNSTKTHTAALVQVNNEIGTTSDSVVVSGLSAGDIVKLYSASVGDTLLTSATVATGATSVKVSTDKLVATGGTIYLTITKSGSTTEGKRISVKYGSETVSKPISKSLVKITNNLGTTNDTIEVSGLVSDDVVKVYTLEKNKTAIATETVEKNATSVTIKTDKLKASGGIVFLTVTNANKTESKKVAIIYSSEKSKPITNKSVKITNNAGTTNDTIEVSGLVSGDIVNVYSSERSTTAIATATVGSGATSATIKTDKLKTSGGVVFLTVTNANKTESKKVAVNYISESGTKNGKDKKDDKKKTTALVTVTNNTGTTDDSIAVSCLTAGDVVKVYSTADATTAMATATVASGATSVKITTDQLVAAGGTIYVGVTRSGSTTESSRIAVKYASETASKPLSKDSVKITNNAGTTSDSIVVSGLTAGDVIKVYSTADSTTVIATATVAAGATSVTLNTDKLVAKGGVVFITVTNANKTESSKVAVNYTAESGTSTDKDKKNKDNKNKNKDNKKTTVSTAVSS